LTHGCCWDDSVVVGSPSHDQRIELLNHLRLWSVLQVLQSLIDGSQVTLARFLAGGDDGFDPQRVFVGSKSPHEGGDNGLAPQRVLLFTLPPGDFLYCLLANIEPQEIEADLALIGRQGM